MTEEEFKTEHNKCRHNKESIQNATQCGCFYCLRVFPPDRITEWVDREGTTALCPFCGIDSVLADPDERILGPMHERWFHLGV